MISTTIDKNLIVPPGDTVKEIIDYKQMPQKELATRLGVSAKHINEIIKGKAFISTELANKLELVLGMPAHFWINLDTAYQEELAAYEEEQRLLELSIELDNFPIKDMIKKGWIEASKNLVYQTKLLLQFFEVASFDNLRELMQSSRESVGLYKIDDRFTIDDYALKVWLRKGEIEAEKIETSPFNRTELINMLPELRDITNITDPNEFIPLLQNKLATVGVAVVLVPEIKNCRASGVARWLSKDKCIVQLSVRYKQNDRLWFAFFHEIGHILHHAKKDIYLESVDIDKTKEIEQEADEFAANTMISMESMKFFDTHPISLNSIKEFSKSQKIHPGIVVGRLQHEGKLSYQTTLNHLKISYSWK